MTSSIRSFFPFSRNLPFIFEYRRSSRIPVALTVLSLAAVSFALYQLRAVQDLSAQMLEALLILLAIKLLEEKKRSVTTCRSMR